VWTSLRREDVREERGEEIGKRRTKNIVRRTETTQNQMKGEDRDRDRIERGRDLNLSNQQETVLSREETSSTSGMRMSIND